MVLVHTGWGSLWMNDNAKFVATSPGISVAAAELLVEEEVVLVGSDNWGVEVMPNPDADLSAPVHQLFLARNGIYIHENLATETICKALMAAVANAIYDATGVRLRRVPFKAERVLGALKAACV